MTKYFFKTIISLYYLVVLVSLTGLFALSAAPAEAMIYEPQVQIGEQEKSIAIQNNLRPIGNYITNVYRYAIGGIGILATVVMMFGGIVWITAGGNASRVGEAKAWVGAALTGLALALTSYMILNTINPALVKFNDQEIRTVPTTPAEKDLANDINIATSRHCRWGGDCAEHGDDYVLETNTHYCEILNKSAGLTNCCCIPETFIP